MKTKMGVHEFQIAMFSSRSVESCFFFHFGLNGVGKLVTETSCTTF